MLTRIPSSTLEKFTTFGDMLRFLRRRAGLTQTDLAIEVGYSNTQISRLEQNQRLPDITTIEARFVHALGIENEPEALEKLLDLAASMRREDAPTSGLCPYKGLSYYDEADADLFAGREALTSRLVEQVLSLAANRDSPGERFLAIVGASGSGKSSLVRAGLVPSLRWNKVSADWQIYVLTPTAHPLESLAAAMTHESNSVATTAALMDDLARDPRSLQIFGRRIASQEHSSCLLLVVDQFEELFTLCHLEEERASFIDNLLEASSWAAGPVMVVITLRADFYAHCAGYTRLREALARQQQYIGAMNDDELRRAIEEAAQRGRWEFEPGLVDLLLHDVGHEPGALPLLSHALLETWQRRRGRTMTLSGYTSSRGVRGAIAETAETVFADQFNQEQQTIARRIFLRLTELGDETDTADTRRRATFEELILKPEEAADTHVVLKALADARLITTSEDSVEVAHEALIREWPTLRSWLEDNREALRLHRQLTDASLEWFRNEKDPDMLYRGLRLAQVREWAATHEEEMNALESAFLGASIEVIERELKEREDQQQRELETMTRLAEAEKQRAEEQIQTALLLRRRARYLAGVLAIAVIATLAAGIFAYQANANFTHTHAQRLAAEANRLMQSGADPQLIALLSIQSIETEHTLEGDAALSGASGLALPLKLFIAPSNPVYSAAISPDGRYVLSVSRDLFQMWDVQTGEEIHRLDSEIEPIRTTLSRDGKYILISGLRGTAQMVDVETGQMLQNFSGHQGPVVSSDVSPDGRYVVTGSLDKTAILWDVETGEEIRRFIGHTEAVEWVEFSPDGEFILTAGLDRTARLWQVGNGEELLKFVGHTEEIPSADFSPDGKTIVTGSHDKSVRIWDVNNGTELRQLVGHDNRVNSVAFSPDGRTVLSGSDDKTMRLWDAQTGRELQQFSGQAGSISEVAFSLDGQYLLSSSFDGSTWLWDAHRAFGEYPAFIHDQAISRAIFSPDGRYLVTAGTDSFVRLWDAQSGKEIRKFSGHSSPWIYSVDFSPDGRFILSGSVDGTARLWDVQTGQALFVFKGQDTGTSTVLAAFSPDGTSVVSASWDGTVRLWDTETGALKTSFIASPGGINGLAFSPDGHSIITGSHDNMVRLWDIQTGNLLREFVGHIDIVNAVSISPDGTYALSSSFDKVARLWNIQTGEEVQQWTGNTESLFGVAFSPIESVALIAGGDNTARLWDFETGQELRRFTGHTGPVEWVAFSPDGKLLATASQDGSARLWDVDYRDTIRYLCSVLLRDFTEAERVQYDIPDNRPTCPDQSFKE